MSSLISTRYVFAVFVCEVCNDADVMCALCASNACSHTHSHTHTHTLSLSLSCHQESDVMDTIDELIASEPLLTERQRCEHIHSCCSFCLLGLHIASYTHTHTHTHEHTCTHTSPSLSLSFCLFRLIRLLNLTHVCT